MADNQGVMTGDGGSAFTVATDEIAGVHFQKMKLIKSTADSTAATGIAGNPLTTGGDAKRVRVVSAGLTTAAVPYAIGDQLGTIFTIAAAANAAGGTGIIRSLIILDKADVMTDARVWLFRASVTLATDNTAFAISDGDMESIVAVIVPTAAIDAGGNRILQWLPPSGEGLGYDCVATSLFAAIETRTANNQFGAVTDVNLIVNLALD